MLFPWISPHSDGISHDSQWFSHTFRQVVEANEGDLRHMFFSMAISGTQFLDSLDQYIVSIGIWVHS